jgi:hypothetical protein
VIVPNRRYVIRTGSGQVHIRNWRFIRRRVPGSSPAHPHGSAIAPTSEMLCSRPELHLGLLPIEQEYSENTYPVHEC